MPIIVLTVLMIISVISSVVCVITLVKKSKRDIDIDSRLEEFDQAFEDAVTEINKIAAIIDNEINEKYRAILFLYNLMEDKVPTEIKESKPEPVSKTSIYDKARELAISGHTVAEIAKTLGIGQGEVQLIVDLHTKKEKV